MVEGGNQLSQVLLFYTCNIIYMSALSPLAHTKTNIILKVRKRIFKRQADFWVRGQPGLQSEFTGQPGLHRETLSQKNKEQTNKKECIFSRFIAASFPLVIKAKCLPASPPTSHGIEIYSVTGGPYKFYPYSVGTKYPCKELQRQSLEMRRKEGPCRDCRIWGSIP